MGKKSLVKISSSPGKTRELNFFLVNEAFYFVDLPGLGYAKMSIKQRYVMGDMIREYVENCPQLRGIVYLVDMRHIGVQLDLETVEILRGLGKPVLVVGSKRDKLTQSEAAKAVKEIQAKFELPHPPICVSVLKRTSIEVLWNNLLEAVATEPS
jgi:GTP-binding protein